MKKSLLNVHFDCLRSRCNIARASMFHITLKCQPKVQNPKHLLVISSANLRFSLSTQFASTLTIILMTNKRVGKGVDVGDTAKNI